MIRVFSFPAAVLIFISLLAGCSLSDKDTLQSFSGYAIGTSYSIKYVSQNTEPQTLQLGVEGVLSKIDRLMSTYLPKSDISTISAAPINQPIKIASETAEVLQAALSIAAATDGRFDPTIAPLVNLWGFGPVIQRHQLPNPDDIDRLLARIDYRALDVQLDDPQVTKFKELELDLSAIAKGYAVDQIARFLEAKGINNYLVEVGGEMRLSGLKPNNESWRIAIEKPDVAERSAYRVLAVSDIAIATSGDYRNYFEIDGNRYSHTIDPSTGYPIVHNLASVTVMMDSSMQADAYATAFLVMGVEEAFSYAEAHNIAAFFITKADNEEGFESLQTSAYSALIEKSQTH
ncbi:FAD:protein FMN transferase [Reinekea thalattae]|uniref:FAD:protein FMN transferase n=1 Tax=Reinekea thalattae TaxID=2593301 RepID=A0A5C8Z7H2_9GAMM|nr:FAD:protein FMN transferase [Reinekea thalattae]TXR53587.1 FAD:protein FMN transferase [Reinekea thalattae]